MNDPRGIGDQFRGLPMSDLIGGPLQAATAAQEHLAGATKRIVAGGRTEPDSEGSLVTTSVSGPVAHVRLNRPDKLNALTMAMFAEVGAAIDALAARANVRAVVIAGEGRAFSAGIDLAALAGAAPDDLLARTHGEANALQHAAWGWRRLSAPVIAAIHGVCFGAGLQIALGADIRLAAPDAELALLEMRWAIVPDVAAFPLLRGLVRDDHARELVLTGRRVGAEEAAAIGLVTRVVDDPLAEATALAERIAAASPAAVHAAKRLLNHRGTDAELLLAEAEEQTALLNGGGVREAMQAAAEKRAPVYPDR